MAMHEFTVGDYHMAARMRVGVFCTIFVLIAWLVNSLALSAGTTGGVLLLLGVAVIGVVAFVFWRPEIGLYTALLLDVIMDPMIPGDTLSKYTGYYHLDLNTFLHPGIAFNPGELLLAITTLVYLLRTLNGSTKLRGGSLARPMLVFGVCLLGGYVWGAMNHGDTKIGLFEVRGPFMLVMLYFLVTNLMVTARHLQRLLTVLVIGVAVTATMTVLRLVVVFHGHGGGPDSSFSLNHDDAVFFSATIDLCVARLAFGITSARQKAMCFLLVAPACVALFEMQRSAAFASFFFGLVVLVIALFLHRRRFFLRVTPPVLIIVVAYTGIFWNSTSSLAGPIRAWHRQSTSASALDTRDYESNLYRVNEKADVRDTILQSPLTGIGFGRPYLDTHPLVDMTSWWPFEFYTPHIEVFWIWLKVGAIGFTVFFTVIGLALQRAGELIRRAGRSPLGFLGVVAATYVVMLLVFAYVDVGLFNERCEILLGTMVGIIGIAPRFLASQQAALPTVLRPFAVGRANAA
jgi:hypothetical protein